MPAFTDSTVETSLIVVESSWYSSDIDVKVLTLSDSVSSAVTDVKLSATGVKTDVDVAENKHRTWSDT